MGMSADNSLDELKNTKEHRTPRLCNQNQPQPACRETDPNNQVSWGERGAGRGRKGAAVNESNIFRADLNHQLVPADKFDVTKAPTGTGMPRTGTDDDWWQQQGGHHGRTRRETIMKNGVGSGPGAISTEWHGTERAEGRAGNA